MFRVKILVPLVCVIMIASALTVVVPRNAEAITPSYVFPPATNEILAATGAAEVSIAMNPVNNLNMAIAHNYVMSGSPVSYTTDGGYTWQLGTIAENPWGDPFLSYDSRGNLYYVSFYSSTAGRQLQVSKSTDGGANFGPMTIVAKVNDPVRFQTGGNANGVLLSTYLGDFCKIACDQTSSPYRDNVYVVFDGYVDTTGDGVSDYFGRLFRRSTDGGLTWSQLMPISARASRDVPHGQLSMNIGIGADGTIYIAMEAGEWLDQAQGSPYIVKSTDGGRSFTAPALIFPNPSAYGLKYFNRFPVVVNHPTQIPRVYLAFAAQMQESTDHDIFVSRSDDYGVTWQTPVRVNDDPVNNGVLQRGQFMSISPNGRLDITWWDYRYSTGAQYADMFYAYSNSGAASFSPNVRLTATTTWFDTHHFYANDYSTIVSLTGKAVAAYAYPTGPEYPPPPPPLDAYVNHISIKYALDMRVNNPAWGSTDPAVGVHQYGGGAVVSATAIPSAGYVLDYWMLDSNKIIGNPIHVTMNQDYVLEAVFRQQVTQTYELTVNAVYFDRTWKPLIGPWVKIDGTTVGVAGGTFTVSAGQHVIEVQTPYSAKGKTYVFQYWQNDLPASNPGSLSVNTDMTITACYYR